MGAMSAIPAYLRSHMAVPRTVICESKHEMHLLTFVFQLLSATCENSAKKICSSFCCQPFLQGEGIGWGKQSLDG